MAKNSSAARPTGQGVPGSPVRTQGRLGLAAVILAVLALPAALFPWLGMVVAVVVLLVSLIALIVALRSENQSRGYPMVAVAVSIVAVALSGIVTNSTAESLQDCTSTSADDVRGCMEDSRNDGG